MVTLCISSALSHDLKLVNSKSMTTTVLYGDVLALPLSRTELLLTHSPDSTPTQIVDQPSSSGNCRHIQD